MDAAQDPRLHNDPKILGDFQTRLLDICPNLSNKIHRHGKAKNYTIVWNKKVKIKYRTMIGPKEQGGLDTPDFQIITETLQVVWVRRLSDSNGTASWSHMYISYLQPVGGLFLLQCNFDLKLLKVDIPIDFYKEALWAWQKINCSTPNTKKQVLNEIVWNNHHIKNRWIFRLLKKMGRRRINKN